MKKKKRKKSKAETACLETLNFYTDHYEYRRQWGEGWIIHPTHSLVCKFELLRSVKIFYIYIREANKREQAKSIMTSNWWPQNIKMIHVQYFIVKIKNYIYKLLLNRYSIPAKTNHSKTQAPSGFFTGCLYKTYFIKLAEIVPAAWLYFLESSQCQLLQEAANLEHRSGRRPEWLACNKRLEFKLDAFILFPASCQKNINILF